MHQISRSQVGREINECTHDITGLVMKTGFRDGKPRSSNEKPMQASNGLANLFSHTTKFIAHSLAQAMRCIGMERERCNLQTVIA